jgi:hypothetical protein
MVHMVRRTFTEKEEKYLFTYWLLKVLVANHRCAIHHNHGGWITVKKLKKNLWLLVSLCLYFTSLYTDEFSYLNIQQHYFNFVQLWDLDNILQGSISTQRNENAVVDNNVDSDDDDEMDVDNKPSKSTKGRMWLGQILPVSYYKLILQFFHIYFIIITISSNLK